MADMRTVTVDDTQAPYSGTEWLFQLQRDLARLGEPSQPGTGRVDPIIKRQQVINIPGAPHTPIVDAVITGRCTAMNLTFETLTPAAIADLYGSKYTKFNRITRDNTDTITAHLIQGNNSDMSADRVEVTGVEIDLRGMQKTLCVMHINNEIKCFGIAGNNNNLRARRMLIAGVRVKMDLGSDTEFLISGGKISATAVSGTANRVVADGLFAVGVLLEYHVGTASTPQYVPSVLRDLMIPQTYGFSTPISALIV